MKESLLARRLADPLPLVMAIVNITPDSFSGDGSLGAESVRSKVDKAIEQGADILDIGAESTRPGATPLTPEQEQARLGEFVPLLRARHPHIPISVDTRHSQTARLALKQGAEIINNIAGNACGEEMNAMLSVLADWSSAWLVLMDNRARLGDLTADGRSYAAPAMSRDASSERNRKEHNIVDSVCFSLTTLAENARKAGLSRIICDPGLGFGKSVQENLQLVCEIEKLTALGHPVLVGASRKSFIGKSLNLEINQRLEAGLALAVWASRAGARIIRTHDVLETRRALDMTHCLIEAHKPRPKE